MIKKQDKLISSAESKAHKAASKAKELHKLTDGIKSAGGTGGETSLPGSSHSNKKEQRGFEPFGRYFTQRAYHQSISPVQSG